MDEVLAVLDLAWNAELPPPRCFLLLCTVEFCIPPIMNDLAKEAFFTGKSPVFRTVIGTIVLRAEIIVLKHVGRYGFLGRVRSNMAPNVPNTHAMMTLRRW